MIKSSFLQKEKIKSIYIDNLEFNSFKNSILNNLTVDVNYSLLFKAKYNSSHFGMLGPQQGFKLSNVNDLQSIELLYNDLIDRIENFMDKYNAEEIELIQVIYIVLSENPKLKLTNINNIDLNKNLVKVREVKEKFNDKFLPLTVNTNYFGKLLVNENYHLYLDIINKQRELLGKDILNDNEIASAYLYNNKFIIISFIEKDSVINRSIYSVNSGILLENVIDVILNKNTFNRKISNVNLTICKDKIINISINKDLSFIKPDLKFSKEIANPLIGSLDIEAFKDLDGYAKVYAIGYVVLNYGVKTFYLHKGKTSNDLLLDCIDELLDKYNGYLFYTHNFGKYDSVFINKILKESNIKRGFDYYILTPVYKDDVLLKLDIKIKNKKITIIDSYNLLNSGLYDLSISFNLDVTKGYFPHKFVKRDTLYYIGNTPSIEYWKNISLDEYKNLYKKDWDLKGECLSYLEKDLVSLLNIMDTFNKYILRNYDVQMTESRTISRLALNIFLKHYLKESKLPVIKGHIFNEVKQAYFGGVTEVYKPYGKNLYYYDVNSLYPYSALNSMPGNKCTYVKNYNNISLNLDNLFGFFHCEVEANENYLGLLPVRSDLGLIMPNGKWSGWYFSEEIKFAVFNGHKINVIEGYNFDKEENVFNDYVNDLYKVKSTSKGHIKVIAKSLLNNLLGRFGMNINKPITEIVDKEKRDLILSTREINSFKELTDEDFIITYYPEISQAICKSHGIDYIKALKTKFDMEKDKEVKDVSLSTAAAVTSYSRIYMSRIKLDILSKGGKIYYTDTDSIVTNIKLKEEFVGNKLGQFKLEYEIKEGYFISAKTYCLVLKDICGIYDLNNNLVLNFKNSRELAEHLGISNTIVNKYLNKDLIYNDLYRFKDIIIVKVKGLFNNSINLEDFKNLYKGVNVKGIKQNTVTVYNEGSVVIDEKEIDLNADSYRKRRKICKKEKWIDTKPLILNNNCTIQSNSDSKLKYINNRSKLNNTFKLSIGKNKKLSNHITKHNFSTYNSRSKLLFNKFMNNIIDISKTLLVLLILILLSFIYIAFFEDDSNNIFNDNINTINSIEINKTPDNNRIIDLFKNKNSNDNNCKSVYSLNTEYYNKSDLHNDNNYIDTNKSIIINEVNKLHLNLANNEILNLRDEVSLLKIKMLDKDVELIEKIKYIEEALNCMENYNSTIKEISTHKYNKSI
jgi:hypothetical protein